MAQQGGGNSGDPSGLGQPGFGWGTDPKTGAYRYGKMGTGGLLEPGTGEIPPTDPAAPHTTGSIPVIKRSGGGGLGAGIAAVVVVFFLIVGGVVGLTALRVSHAVTNMFPSNCAGGPQIGLGGVEIGNGQIRVPCIGGGTMIVNTGGGGGPFPTVKPTPHHHHHRQNANG